MLKNLFEQLYRLIFQPSRAWNILINEKEENVNDKDFFLKNYIYPVIGIVALFAFIGVFFHRKEFDIQLALRLMIKVVIALFAGFYLASFLLSKVIERFFSNASDYKLCQRFVGYSSALIYVMYMVLGIFPEFDFLQLILLYTIYIVWEGAPVYMQISDGERGKFTAAASAIVLLSPIIIEKIMFLTMPGMRT